jgi:protein-L-isoaspartate(D-aspartate) O-methyltransferase
MKHQTDMTPDIARFNMVEQQIRTWQVLDLHVLSLLSRLDRHVFVPAAFQSLAYSDTELPLAHGECMLAPRVDARLLQDLQLQAHEQVLEIGTGSGYLTALLAMSCAHVTSLECHLDFIAPAQQRLNQCGIRNAELLHSEGVPSASTVQSYDAIVLGGSVASVPVALLAMLKPGGRLLAVIGEEPVMCATRVVRQADGQGHSQALWDVVTPRLHGFAETPAFHF